MFEPIRTGRLLLRPVTLEDAEGLFVRRNDPEMTRYASWTVPFPRERAQQMIEDIVAMEGPVSGEWWMLIIADPATGAVYGDLALHLLSEGRIAEVGYTLAPAHWGKGYATEAVAALIAYVFETLGVTRVVGIIHPDNRASAMVLERTGLLFEGHTRLSYWVGDVASDDIIYGMTRSDWEAWRDRLRTPPTEVRLVEVSDDNLREVLDLRTHKSQESFVAPTVLSLARAQVPEIHNGHPLSPWYRAIEADGGIVGFVMLALSTADFPEPLLWRLLIDRMHQRRGIAGRALDLVEDEVRGMGDAVLITSFSEGRGSPGPFYLARGYAITGEVVGDEIYARKEL